MSASSGSVVIAPERLLAERRRRGWSQRQLAEKAGLTRQAISNLEAEPRVALMRTVLGLSGALGVPSERLIRVLGAGDSAEPESEQREVKTENHRRGSGWLRVPVWGSVPGLLNEIYERGGVGVDVQAAAVTSVQQPAALEVTEDQEFHDSRKRLVFRVARGEHVLVDFKDTEPHAGRLYVVIHEGVARLCLWPHTAEEEIEVLARVRSVGSWRSAP